MKQFRVTIIAIIVLVVAIVGYVVAKNYIGKETTDPEDDIQRELVLSFKAADVIKIESSYKEKFVIELTDGKWLSTSHEDLNIMETNITSLLSSYAAMMGNVIIDEGEEINYSNFGFLDDPPYITLFLSDGTSHKLLLGNTTLSGNELFVMFEGGKKVYKISSSYSERLHITRASYETSRIFSDLDKERISTIELQRNGELKYIIKADFSTEEKSWTLSEPAKMKGNDSQINALVDALRGLSLGSLVETNVEDLSIYGLDLPIARYIVKDNKLTKSLEIGGKTPDGYYRYCTVNESNHIYLIATANFNFVDDPVTTYIFIYPFLVNHIELTHVRVTIGDDIYNLDYDVTDDDENFWFNGANVNKPDNDLRRDFKKITTAMYSLALETLEEEPRELGKLLTSIEYTTRDGEKTLVEYIERDETTAYIYVNGEYFNGYLYTRRIFSNNEEALKLVIESFAQKMK